MIWAETRPAEGGRTQLVRRRADGARTDLLPDGQSARTAVHEYGGGAWWARDGVVWFAAWDDQRLYRLDIETGSAVPITPSPADAPRGPIQRRRCESRRTMDRLRARTSPRRRARRGRCPQRDRQARRARGFGPGGARDRPGLRREPPLESRRRPSVLDRVGPPAHAVGRDQAHGARSDRRPGHGGRGGRRRGVPGRGLATRRVAGVHQRPHRLVEPLPVVPGRRDGRAADRDRRRHRRAAVDARRVPLRAAARRPDRVRAVARRV